jgi:hypothetical protein
MGPHDLDRLLASRLLSHLCRSPTNFSQELYICDKLCDVPVQALVLSLDHFQTTGRKIAHLQDTPSLALVVGVHRRDKPLKILVAQ